MANGPGGYSESGNAFDTALMGQSQTAKNDFANAQKQYANLGTYAQDKEASLQQANANAANTPKPVTPVDTRPPETYQGGPVNPQTGQQNPGWQTQSRGADRYWMAPQDPVGKLNTYLTPANPNQTITTGPNGNGGTVNDPGPGKKNPNSAGL